jgi:two-component system, OmpR family, osmolarity sensor histidine kinase EnvZ
MAHFRPRLRSLFARTAAAIAVALIAYDLFSHAVLGYYFIGPVARRSADDLAALMTLTANVSVDPDEMGRTAPPGALLESYGLRVGEPGRPLMPAGYSPYLRFLEDALHRRTGAPVLIGRDASESEEWLWTDVRTTAGEVRLGFSVRRLELHPGVALFVLLLAGATLTFGTALVYVRRITRPLARLAEAAGRIGQGEFCSPLPVTGPDEIAGLTRSFNSMTRQVKELLAARTTMLAGISHDLRTPLTRLNLSLELLSARPDPRLILAMRRDIEAMNALIGEFLEIARGLEKEDRVPVSLRKLLDELADDVRRTGGAEVQVSGPNCEVMARLVALRRVLVNLIDNAVRYGGGRPIEITLRRDSESCSVHILDHGPGIPKAERELVFQPFYRIEKSRNSASGGSGLGLAVARQLAEVNGWELDLLPGPGVGTEAVLRMPISASEGIPESA